MSIRRKESGWDKRKRLSKKINPPQKRESDWEKAQYGTGKVGKLRREAASKARVKAKKAGGKPRYFGESLQDWVKKNKPTKARVTKKPPPRKSAKKTVQRRKPK